MITLEVWVFTSFLIGAFGLGGILNALYAIWLDRRGRRRKR